MSGGFGRFAAGRPIPPRPRPADTTETPAGTYAAIPVERIHSNPKRTTVSWYAPALDYLPVRIEQHKPDGERITMALIEHQVLPCQPTEP